MFLAIQCVQNGKKQTSDPTVESVQSAVVEDNDVIAVIADVVAAVIVVVVVVATEVVVAEVAVAIDVMAVTAHVGIVLFLSRLSQRIRLQKQQEPSQVTVI